MQTMAQHRAFALVATLAFALVSAPVEPAGAETLDNDVVPGHLRAQWPDTDFANRVIDLDSVRSGGPPKDGIPSIDDPKFVSTEAAAAWLDPREPVIVVEHGGTTKAYPLQILTWHEIVNDTIAGLPVAVTFCPLCNAAIVFDRRLDGEAVEFGTTGKLRKSDLVMYDRRTESWWQQFTGRGIVGAHAGDELDTVPSRLVAFEDLAAARPDARVLSRDTGYQRSYGRNPYAGYDKIGNNPFMLDEAADPRLPAMTRVLGIETAEAAHVYTLTALAQEPVRNVTLGGRPILLLATEQLRSVLDRSDISASRTVPAANAYERRVGDRVLTFERREGGIHDRETGSRWNALGEAVAGPLAGTTLSPVDGAGVHFAFAWLAFRPDTTIHKAGDD